jgi:Leucine-rich repeat (LRR) protein
MPDLATLLIERNKAERSTFLDLGNCGLSALPEELADMKWLERLNLGGLYFDKVNKKYVRSANDGESNTFLGAKLSLLTELPVLKDLSLSQTPVADTGTLPLLKALESLDVSYTSIQEVVLNLLPNLKWLNLRQSSIITDKFSFFENLTKLEFLDISYTSLPDYAILHRSVRLKSLYLHSCGVTDISFLLNFPELEFLDLHRNLVTDYSPLKRLRGLKDLDISENRIGDYNFLNEFTRLESLNISENRISDFNFLFNLPNLMSLNLNHNGEADYRFIAKLTLLQKLFLSYNKIFSIDFLANLENLEILELRDNQISDITPLVKLARLKTLDLDFNQISSIDALRNLKNLKILSLESNNISNLRPLKNLKALESLALNTNEINEVQDLLPLHSILTKSGFQLTIADNPIIKKTALVLDRHQNHTESILNLLHRHLELDKHEVVLPAKVLLLGNHASGKSSLLHYIKNQNLTGTTSSTHIIKVEKYPSGQDFPSAIFFDFGGQDYYHGIYRAFLSMGSLQIILWNTENNRNAIRPTDANGLATRDYNLNYWLGQKQYMEAKSGGDFSRVLLVQSYADVDARIFQAFENNTITNEYFLSLSSLSEEKEVSHTKKIEYESGRKHFLASLLYLIEESQLKREEPQWYIDFLEYILKHRTAGNLFEPVALNELRAIYKNPNNYSLEGDLDQLHRKGLILYYREMLPECVWLNPEELVKHVHDTILSKEKLVTWKGRLPAKELAGYNEHILKLLTLQKVIFEHVSPEGKEYIIPNYLPLAQNDKDYGLFSFGVQTAIFVLRFEQFIPFGLINQMICFYGTLPDVKKFWRDQVLFAFNNKLILIRIDFNNLEIRVQSTANTNNEENQYLFYSIIALYWDFTPLSFEEYRSTNATSPNSTLSGAEKDSSKSLQFQMFTSIFTEERYFPSDLYISVDDKYYIHYRDMEKLDIIETKITGYPLEDQKLNKWKGKELALHPFQPFTKKPLRKTKNLFISYSHDDKAYRTEVQKFLVNLEREKLIEIWQDGMINPGDEWDEKINNSLENADIIVLLVSQSFINSSYIHEIEMTKAVKKAEAKSAVILPILLKNCDWEQWKVVPDGIKQDNIKETKGNIGKYQFLPLDDDEQRLIPVVKWANKEDAWMKLVNTIRKMV